MMRGISLRDCARRPTPIERDLRSLIASAQESAAKCRYCRCHCAPEVAEASPQFSEPIWGDASATGSPTSDLLLHGHGRFRHCSRTCLSDDDQRLVIARWADRNSEHVSTVAPVRRAFKPFVPVAG